MSWLRDRYTLLHADQRRILREAFTRWQGQEVDTQSDPFFVAFPRASQAVSAAVGLQHAPAAQVWPEDVLVCDRMDLHTGEPRKTEEGCIGTDIHRAARLAHVDPPCNTKF